MADRLTAKSWRGSQQKIPRGLARAVAFDAVRRHILAETEKRLREHVRVDNIVRV
jgi:hypothetical protein